MVAIKGVNINIVSFKDFLHHYKETMHTFDFKMHSFIYY